MEKNRATATNMIFKISFYVNYFLWFITNLYYIWLISDDIAYVS